MKPMARLFLGEALAVAGLSVIGRDKWGVFPLRGKAGAKWEGQCQVSFPLYPNSPPAR